MARGNFRRAEELQAVGRLMADPAGRRWVYSILTQCHLWHTSMASNAIRLAFLEGERSTGLQLLSEITEANQDMVFQMMKEHGGERQPGSGAGDDDDGDGDGGV